MPSKIVVMPRSELYLVGTVHVDPYGASRLKKILHKLQPGFISIEATESPSTWGFERQTAMRYHLGRMVEGKDFFLGKGISCNDIHTGLAKEVIEEAGKQIQQLEEKPISWLEHYTEGLYSNKYPVTPEQIERYGLFDRDSFASARIRKAYLDLDGWWYAFSSSTLGSLLGERPNRRIIHIGGLNHIFGNYHNLYEKLKDLNPIRIKLNEADKY